jgi:hypothetical protein
LEKVKLLTLLSTNKFLPGCLPIRSRRDIKRLQLQESSGGFSPKGFLLILQTFQIFW